MSQFDVAIIGAGIAGASLAATLAGRKSVLLLEAEDQPGYHSTGRSAAFWSETYGGPGVQPLTTASKSFLESPPADFFDRSFLQPRGALYIGKSPDQPIARAMLAEFAASHVTLKPLDAGEIEQHLEGRRDGWDVAVWEPDCCDIDVAALHATWLSAARRTGTATICRAQVTALAFKAGHWAIETAAGNFDASIVVNAAGAWADEVANLAQVGPLGIQPFRRTIMQLQVSPPASAHLPLVVGFDGSFYFKPESGGRLWLSPHDEIPTVPCDAAPEELDVATAIARLEEVVDWKIEKLERKWAGLRSFAPDRLPVIGRDPANEQFFWLGGQGGFGIQTAPAVAELGAMLLCDSGDCWSGIDAATYAPGRFR